MFNSIKVHLVPHFSIILLHSLKLSVLNIYYAKFHARPLRNSKIYVACSAQITHDIGIRELGLPILINWPD